MSEDSFAMAECRAKAETDCRDVRDYMAKLILPEMQRFIKRQGIEPPREQRPQDVPPADPNDQQPNVGRQADARHSPDFRSVNWYGQPYSFTTNQAACVRVLWEAWKNKTPALSGPEILDAAGSSNDRLDQVFRVKRKGKVFKHFAWETMIVVDTRGAYRLDPPSGV